MGSPAFDQGQAVSTDGLGNVYLSGFTPGDIARPGNTKRNAFVAKYDSSGTLKWARQLGEPPGIAVLSYGVSADQLGNVFIAGSSDSGAYAIKYDSNGVFQWKGTFNTTYSTTAYAVSADGLGGVYISGEAHGPLGGPTQDSSDAFVAKFDGSGVRQWTRQIGSAERDFSQGVSSDGIGNVYVAGTTDGNLAGNNAGSDDVFLRKYDTAGTLLWTRQYGTVSADLARCVSADALGNIFVAGTTFGNLEGTNAGGLDAFISKFDANGTLVWNRQFGTASYEQGWGVSADGQGNVYVGGASGFNAFVRKFDANGNLTSSGDFECGVTTQTYGVSTDKNGAVYLAGYTSMLFGGSPADAIDAFLLKVVDQELPDVSGDFDGNAVVDGADFLLWQRGEAPDGASPEGLADWLSNFGAGTQIVAESVPVPEPVNNVVFAIAATAFASYSRLSTCSRRRVGALAMGGAKQR